MPLLSEFLRPRSSITGSTAKATFSVRAHVEHSKVRSSNPRSPGKIRAKAIEEKMLDFRKAALLKVARGETSTEEVLRVIPSEQLLADVE